MDKTIPGLSKMIDKAASKRGMALLGWLTFAAGVVALIAQLTSQSGGASPEQIEQIVEHVYEEQHPVNPTTTPNPAAPTPPAAPQSPEEPGSASTP